MPRLAFMLAGLRRHAAPPAPLRMMVCCLLAMLAALLQRPACAQDLDEGGDDLMSQMLADDSALEKWAHADYPYRQRFTLVRKLDMEKTDLAAVTDLSLRRLQEQGKLGPALVVIDDQGDKLTLQYDAATDLCSVPVNKLLGSRSFFTLMVYYGKSGTDAFPAPPARALTPAQAGLYQCFAWREETQKPQPQGPSPLAQKSIERYGRLILLDTVAGKQETRVADANLNSLAKFADNAGSVPTSGFAVEQAGRYLLRLRLHASAPAKADLQVKLEGPAAAIAATLTAAGHGFFWAQAQVDLSAGAYRQAVISGPAAGDLAVDFLSLSPDLDWQPEYDALCGPVWVRYRVPAAATMPTKISMSATYSTYTINGPQSKPNGEFYGNCWFEKPALHDLMPAALIAKNLPPGAWGPWGKLLERGSWTWWETAVISGGPGSAVGGDIEIQFATGPAESRVIRHNRTAIVSGQVQFRMPPNPNDFASLRHDTRTFEDYLEWRIAKFNQLDLPPGGQLKKLFYSVFSFTEASAALEERKLVLFETMGFNGLDQPEAKYQQIDEKHGMIYHHTHAWITDVGSDWSDLKGETYRQKMDDYRQKISGNILAGKYLSYGNFPHNSRFNVLEDEIGPYASAGAFSGSKHLEQLFLAFLREHQVEPAFFGLKSFAEFRWPPPPLGKSGTVEAVQRRMEAMVNEETSMSLKEDAEKKVFLDEKEEEKHKAKKEEELAAMGDRKAMIDAMEKERAAKVTLAPDPESLEGKRLRYYVRKFTNDFTARICNAMAEGTWRESKELMRSGPNFQASPAQGGTMWDGGLDVLAWGRLQTPASFIQIEDWVGPGGYVNCAFAGAITRSACRPKGAYPACLITGGRCGGKMIAWLGQGIRKFDSYLYGPLWLIGPPWGDDPASYQNIGQSLRQMSRTEDDIVLTEFHSPIAQLLAVSSEIIGKTDIDRRAIFAHAVRQGYNVDILGEDDIETDKRLEHYPLLLVIDRGVRRATQEAVKAWVEGGGHLLLGADAAAFDEFEQPCNVLANLRPQAAPAAEGEVNLTTVKVGKGVIYCISGDPTKGPNAAMVAQAAQGAGAVRQWASDLPDLWMTNSEGNGRQVLYVIQAGHPERTDIEIRVFRDQPPKQVFSAKNGELPFRFESGAVIFTDKIGPCVDLLPIEGYPNTDIIVLRDEAIPAK